MDPPQYHPHLFLSMLLGSWIFLMYDSLITIHPHAPSLRSQLYDYQFSLSPLVWSAHSDNLIPREEAKLYA
jgi:hypothetical protein